MTKPASRFGKTIGNLLLALVNATLILVAVCLYLELRILQKTNEITATFAQNLIQVEPLRDAVQSLSTEAAGLRGELVALREARGAITDAARSDIGQRIDALSAQLTLMKVNVDTIVQSPDQMIEKAVNAGANAAVNAVADLRGCTLPPAT